MAASAASLLRAAQLKTRGSRDDGHPGAGRQVLDQGLGLGIGRAVVDQHHLEVDLAGGGGHRVHAGAQEAGPVAERHQHADSGPARRPAVDGPGAREGPGRHLALLPPPGQGGGHDPAPRRPPRRGRADVAVAQHLGHVGHPGGPLGHPQQQVVLPVAVGRRPDAAGLADHAAAQHRRAPEIRGRQEEVRRPVGLEHRTATAPRSRRPHPRRRRRCPPAGWRSPPRWPWSGGRAHRVPARRADPAPRRWGRPSTRRPNRSPRPCRRRRAPDAAPPGPASAPGSRPARRRARRRSPRRRRSRGARCGSSGR